VEGAAAESFADAVWALALQVPSPSSKSAVPTPAWLALVDLTKQLSAKCLPALTLERLVEGELLAAAGLIQSAEVP
jgi:hypothetical protein